MYSLWDFLKLLGENCKQVAGNKSIHVGVEKPVNMEGTGRLGLLLKRKNTSCLHNV